jgi:hypothetical protein
MLVAVFAVDEYPRLTHRFYLLIISVGMPFPNSP